MNPTLFVPAILLLTPTSAEAAGGIAIDNSNLILLPIPPISTAPPQTNPVGSVLTCRDLGALPGFPGSHTYDPNAALPSLNNAGSALAPTAKTSAPVVSAP